MVVASLRIFGDARPGPVQLEHITGNKDAHPVHVWRIERMSTSNDTHQ